MFNAAIGWVNLQRILPCSKFKVVNQFENSNVGTIVMPAKAGIHMKGKPKSLDSGFRSSECDESVDRNDIKI